MFRSLPSLPSRRGFLRSSAAALLAAGIGVATAPAGLRYPHAPGLGARGAPLPRHQVGRRAADGARRRAVVYELDDVAYGAVSPYIPPRRRHVRRVDGALGCTDGTQPVVQQSIDIAEASPVTVRRVRPKRRPEDHGLPGRSLGPRRRQPRCASCRPRRSSRRERRQPPRGADRPRRARGIGDRLRRGARPIVEPRADGGGRSATSAVNLPAGSVSTLFVSMTPRAR